jgi:tRNA 2-thiouridine synthesizing protein A
MDVTPDKSLDLRGKECPFTVMEIGKALKSLGAGKVLEVLSDRADLVDDVKAWCVGTGTDLLGVDTDTGIRIYLKKADL